MSQSVTSIDSCLRNLIEGILAVIHNIDDVSGATQQSRYEQDCVRLILGEQHVQWCGVDYEVSCIETPFM